MSLWSFIYAVKWY